MNHSRRNKFTQRMASYMADVDNEIQMLCDVHNQHDSGLLGWNAISVEDGANKRMGTVVLAAGTATVSNTSVTANTRIFLTIQDPTDPGAVYVASRIAGTSFTIESTDAADASTVAWLLVEPK